jgi:hypothetical protein
MWSDEAIYKSSDIYYAGSHAYKEAIYSTGILATLKSKPTAKRREKELYLSSLIKDYCYFVTIIRRGRSTIGQHSRHNHAVSLQRIIVVV